MSLEELTLKFSHEIQVDYSLPEIWSGQARMW